MGMPEKILNFYIIFFLFSNPCYRIFHKSNIFIGSMEYLYGYREGGNTAFSANKFTLERYGHNYDKTSSLSMNLKQWDSHFDLRINRPSPSSIICGDS